MATRRCHSTVLCVSYVTTSFPELPGAMTGWNKTLQCVTYVYIYVHIYIYTCIYIYIYVYYIHIT